MTMPPRATLRLQFHRAFTLDDALARIDYIAGLGVSHVYASPLTRARAGSTHGYDVVDFGVINPELGGEAALRRLAAALKARGMGLILDIVPNHMGVGGSENGWWLDVLEWGQASPYADFFDIDWHPPEETLRGRLLAPFLGTPYGEALESGALVLQIDGAAGEIFVGYGEHRFPIRPQDYRKIFAHLPPPLQRELAGPFARPGDARAVKAALAQVTARAGGEVARALQAFGPGMAGRARLHDLLERQHYRLAWWRTAADEINWRRFFDIAGLAGLRIERPEVFDAVHALPLRLYAEGVIDGLRIDHVDGLADPTGYCRRLRGRLEGLRDGPAYLVVEKILGSGETLPATWAIDGTSGYDFMAEVGALLHDRDGEAALTALWSDATGEDGDFAAEVHAAKHQILAQSLGAELDRAARAFHRQMRLEAVRRDLTLAGLRRALAELVVHFPVYRTYLTPAGPDARDRRLIDGAAAAARRTVAVADRPALDYVLDRLTGRPEPTLIARFEQLTAPVTAKSVEDTAFYRYGRLISRNEVGSDPGEFALGVQGFHEACRRRLEHFPKAMLASATHDHKRGEDVRARLAVLSELAPEWCDAVGRWRNLSAPLRTPGADGPVPAPADELMLYQTLVGAWPCAGHADEAFAARIVDWQRKAVREAKRRSNWTAPDEGYEQGAREFTENLICGRDGHRLRAEIEAFARRIAPAGAVNGLAATLLRLTVPGMPDLYQGCDFWDLSLADPDNRRPVDYDARATALAAGASPRDLLADWRDGRVKQAVIARALALRKTAPALFADGLYRPLAVQGDLAGHAMAFLRASDTEVAITVVTRLAARLLPQDGAPLVPPEGWGDTAVLLPDDLAIDSFVDVLCGSAALAAGGRLALREILGGLPVALLHGGRPG